MRRRAPRRPTHRAALDPGAYTALLKTVLARDQYRCRNPWCGRSHDLQGAHLVARSAGGPDTPQNLLTLCARCHQALDEGRLAVTILGTTPTDVLVSWRDCRPRQGRAW